MADEKVRLASIGLANWGTMLANAANRAGNVEIIRCFTRTESAREEFAEKFGCRPAASFEEVLMDSEVEGILIATPHSTHTDLITQAASAGKHVFVEKPLTLTVADANKCIDATEKAGVTLLIGHHRRRQGANRRIREMIDEGALGMIHALEANLSNPNGQNPRSGWRNDPAECPAGGMTGLGVHMVDNLQYLTGPAKRVSAFSKQLFGAGNLDDVTNIILEYESGPLGYITTCYVTPKQCTTSAHGTEASAWSEDEGGRLYLQKKDENQRNELSVDGSDALAEEIQEFGKCIRGEAAPETDGKAAREVVAVLESIVESAKSGRVVEVSEIRGH